MFRNTFSGLAHQPVDSLYLKCTRVLAVFNFVRWLGSAFCKILTAILSYVSVIT